MVQTVENLPAVQETCVQSLGQEDSPGGENGNSPSILVGKISWTEESCGLQAMGSQAIPFLSFIKPIFA